MANPGDIISGMQQEEWDNFLTTSYPMLVAQADKLKTLDTDMYNSGIKNANTVIAMSKLPSKNELIGMLLSVWTAPARMFVTALDEVRKQKESA